MSEGCFTRLPFSGSAPAGDAAEKRKIERQKKAVNTKSGLPGLFLVMGGLLGSNVLDLCDSLLSGRVCGIGLLLP